MHALAGRVGASMVALEKSHQQVVAMLERTEGWYRTSILNKNSRDYHS